MAPLLARPSAFRSSTISGPPTWKREDKARRLVPIFHRALAFHEKLELPAAFVNIGGIANVTYVPDGPPEGLIAFDAGAGNCLLDDWAMKHIGEPLDRAFRPRFSRDSEP